MNRLFCDISNHGATELLDSESIMSKLLNANISHEDIREYQRLLIPCHHLPDPGVSGVILAPHFHFTCHTFTRQGTAYVDACGFKNPNYIEHMVSLISQSYQASKVIQHSVDEDNSCGNFGRHLVYLLPRPTFAEACQIVTDIVSAIDMHKLAEMVTLERARDDYDILQPIVESHIAAHTVGDQLALDVFSCKYFDDTKLATLLPHPESSYLIPRGL